MHDSLLAFTLTLLASLSTGIGSCIAFVARHTNKRFLSVSLGFSVGVMIYVSFIEIFSQAQQALVSQLGQTGGSWATAAAFFGGMLAIAVIDRLIPSQEEFCKEALSRKQRVRQGKMPATQFTSWMIGQEQIIREICTQ